MKKLILLSAVALLGFASCKKGTPSVQKIKYHVECSYCSIYIEDDVWNHLNELERSKNQHFNVSGTFDYEFINTTLDTVSITFFNGSFAKAQNVKASITTNDGKSLQINEKIGFDANGNYPIDKKFFLPLR